MSFIVKNPVLLSNYNLKYRDHAIKNQTTVSNDVENRLVIPEGVNFAEDDLGDKRVGRKTRMIRFEFCAYYRTFIDLETILEIPDFSGFMLRHMFFWDTQAWQGLPIIEEILTDGGNIGTVPYNMVNQDRFIPLYDRRFAFGNLIDRGVEELTQFVAQGHNQHIDEGIMDVTSVYKGGLETIWGSSDEEDIQNGRLIEVDLVDYAAFGVIKDGWVRVWFEDH